MRLHFHLISGLPLRSTPVGNDGPTELISDDTLQRKKCFTLNSLHHDYVTLNLTEFDQSWIWLYICVKGLDLNISIMLCNCASRSECTKGSSSHTPNKLIICVEECETPHLFSFCLICYKLHFNMRLIAHLHERHTENKWPQSNSHPPSVIYISDMVIQVRLN